MKKTKWFPGSQKPELPGVYERDYGLVGQQYSYFDGQDWYIPIDNIASAYGFSDDPENKSRCTHLFWRGLAEKP